MGSQRLSFVAEEGIESIGEKITIESRMNNLHYAVTDISDSVKHIYGILFGFRNEPCELTDDCEQSIDSTLRDIESITRETSKTLEEIASILSNQKRLRAKP